MTAPNHDTPGAALENVNVVGLDPMPTPAQVHERVPLSPAAAATVARGREALRAILERRDPRLFVVVGPCSIHDADAALDYAQPFDNRIVRFCFAKKEQTLLAALQRLSRV